MFFKIIILILTLIRVYGKDYTNYRLVQVFPNHKTHELLLSYLQDDIQLDFWTDSLRDKVDILIPPSKYNYLVEQFKLLRLNFKVINNNIQSDIDGERERLDRKEEGFDYEEFNTIDDINAELEAVVLKCPRGFTCKTNVIGTTVEGRSIKGITIKKPSSSSVRESIYFEATTHAREWLGTATIMKILQHLVDDYGSDDEVTQLVDKYDLHIYPVINQDGYNYTWTPGNRLWRKNRSINPGSLNCPGVDLNRNYDQKWSNAGSSTSPCSDTYRGRSPASELEVQAVQNYILDNPNIKLFVSIHTYGQYWLIPWGSYAEDGRSCNYAEDDAEMMIVANNAANAIEATYNTKWARGNLCATLYPASGITTDFAKDKGGIKYTVTPELRGNSFVVSPDQITPSFNEVWNGITAAIKTIEAQSKI